jgi:hypothetical protein
MNTHERFTLVMADLMRSDVSNSDPMRHSKRTAINAAREALDHGIDQAERLLCLVTAISSDTKDIEKNGGQA